MGLLVSKLKVEESGFGVNRTRDTVYFPWGCVLHRVTLFFDEGPSHHKPKFLNFCLKLHGLLIDIGRTNGCWAGVGLSAAKDKHTD